MLEINGMIGGVLLAGNLLFAEALFLCVLNKAHEEGLGRKLAVLAGWLLEFAVYCAGILRLSELILEGVRAGGGASLELMVARTLLAESMSGLFLLVTFYFKTWRIRIFQGAAAAPAEGEFYIGMVLLLWLTLINWQETDLWQGFGKQSLYLVCFLLLECFRHRRLHFQKRLLEKELARDKETAEAVYQGRQAEYLKNVDIQYQRTRELWHDLKNHIGVLEILARENHTAELGDYLSSFRRDVEGRMIPMQTGCAAVDALLGDKCYQAGRKGIRISLDMCSLSDMTLEASELCAILGNLLDNALEACDRLPRKGRIRISMKQLEDFYYLTVANPSEEPRQEEGRYISHKKEWENGVGHGLGLRSVERIAHQYGGSLVTAYEEGEFKAVVRLQNPSYPSGWS